MQRTERRAKSGLFPACCLSSLALICAGTAGAALLAFLAWRSFTSWRSFAKVEHHSWPKATPQAALTTRSPDDTFITTSEKRGGDGLSHHNERQDCIFVAHRACPDYRVEVSSQDHAYCQEHWSACDPGDGELLHEQFGVKIRWLDASRLELSWIELTGLDAAGHRVWGARSRVYHVVTVQERPDDVWANDPCTRWVAVEPRTP